MKPPRPRAVLFAPSLLLGAALLMPACGEDECRAGMAYCDGNSAVNCEHKWSDSSAPYVFRREPCGEHACRVEETDTFFLRAVCLRGECLTDAECPAGKPYCVGELCAVCRSDADCSGPGTSSCLFADQFRPPCCHEDTSCANCPPPPRCGCSADADCPAESPRCAAGTCER